MKIGYLRVSSEEQNVARQVDILRPLCDRIYVEKGSACAAQRPVFERVLKRLQPGDTLVVLRLDRAFRSTIEAIREAERLRARGIAFQIVNVSADTATADGMLVYTMIAAIAEHERMRLSERTKEGLTAARRRGVTLSRRRKLTDKQVQTAQNKLAQGQTAKDVAAHYRIHPTTLLRAIRRVEELQIE